MKKIIISVTMFAILIGCGSAEKEISTKIKTFSDNALAYEKCVTATPKECAGQFEKLEAESNALFKEINEKIPTEGDWKLNDQYNQMVKKIWDDVRMSQATEKTNCITTSIFLNEALPRPNDNFPFNACIGLNDDN